MKVHKSLKIQLLPITFPVDKTVFPFFGDKELLYVNYIMHFYSAVTQHNAAAFLVISGSRFWTSTKGFIIYQVLVERLMFWTLLEYFTESSKRHDAGD